MRIGVLTNLYPEISHTFIRDEILDLEARGLEIVRMSIRTPRNALVDADDRREQARTFYVLDRPLRLVSALLWATATRPARLLGAAVEAMALCARGGRPVRHLAYLLEAALCARILRQRGVEHLHVHFGTNPAAVALLVQRLGGPGFSLTVHGPSEFDAPHGLSLDRKVQASRFTVAISDYCAAQLRRWAPVESWTRIRVVRCAVRADYVSEPTRTPEDSIDLAFVGRLCAQKDPLSLLDAAAELLRRRKAFHLTFGGDGELRPQLEARIRELGLCDHVTLAGWQSGDDVRRLLRRSRALVLPSSAEGLPIVLLEAMALARPVVTTHVGGIPELVEHGVNGWLVPAGRPGDLADALEEVLATPAQRLAELGAAARRSVMARHSSEVRSRLLERHLRHAVSGGRAKPEP